MSVFDTPWLPMPEQQALWEGGGPGSDADQGGHGAGDQGEGGDGGQGTDAGGGVAGGRGTNPGRGYGGEAAQPGGRGQDEGWDAVGGSYDSEDARALAVKHGYKKHTFKGLFEDAPFPGLLGMAIGAIAKSMKNEKAAREIADELGLETRMARSALGLPSGRGEDDPTREGGADLEEQRRRREEEERKAKEEETPKGEPPKPGTDEYRQALLDAMEEMLGNMPDGNYEVPDWSVIIAQDSPERPQATQEAMPQELLERMDAIRTQAFVSDMAGRLLRDEEERA